MTAPFVELGTIRPSREKSANLVRKIRTRDQGFDELVGSPVPPSPPTTSDNLTPALSEIRPSICTGRVHFVAASLTASPAATLGYTNIYQHLERPEYYLLLSFGMPRRSAQAVTASSRCSWISGRYDRPGLRRPRGTPQGQRDLGEGSAAPPRWSPSHRRHLGGV
jgi:hypothetical protein